MKAVNGVSGDPVRMIRWAESAQESAQERAHQSAQHGVAGALRRLPWLAHDRRAVTALEYGIVAAFFCVGLVTIFTNFGTSVSGLFNTIIVKLQ